MYEFVMVNLPSNTAESSTKAGSATHKASQTALLTCLGTESGSIDKSSIFHSLS